MLSGFAGFVVGALLTELAGAGAGVAAGAWKTDLQPGLSCACFWTMQAVMRSTLGMYSPHSRIASGVQAWRASGLP